MISSQQAVEYQNIPPKVFELANAHQLGQLNHVYKPRISNPLIVIGTALGIIIADMLLFAVLFALGWILYILIAVPVIAIVYLVVGLLRCNLYVYEFQDGLIRTCWGKADVLPWKQIRACWWSSVPYASSGMTTGLMNLLMHASKSGIRQIYIVCLLDGRRVALDGAALLDIQMLGETLQKEVARLHVPPARAALDAGKIIPFGQFSLNLQGVHTQAGAMLAWGQVGGVIVQNSMVFVTQKGAAQTPVSAPQANVPNLAVFVELVNYALYRAQH